MEEFVLPFEAGDCEYIHDISYNTFGTKIAITSGTKIYIYSKKLLNKKEDLFKNKNLISSFIFGEKYVKYKFLNDKNNCLIEDEDVQQNYFKQLRNQWMFDVVLEGVHTEPIWRVDWGHPEYGNLIASCSEDRSINIWIEVSIDGRLKWMHATSFRDAVKPLTDLQFSPPQFGLRMAACDEDGSVRIYELSTKEWNRPNVEEQFYCFDSKTGGCSCISWNDAWFDVMILAVGGKDGGVRIYGKLWEDSSNKWQLLKEATQHSACLDLCWCPNLCRPYDLLATCGSSPCVILWKWEFNQACFKEQEKAANSKRDGRVGAVNAPSRGRRGMVRQPLAAHATRGFQSTEEAKEEKKRCCTLTMLQTFSLHSSPIWRVAWNTIGSILTAASDYTIYFWKSNEFGKWHLVEEVDRTEIPSKIKELK